MTEYEKYLMLVRYNELPHDFTQWELADERGRSIAHEAAYCGYLPENFDRWDIRDKDGETVAHTVAYSGIFPPNFNQWDLEDASGRTVRDIFISSRLQEDN